MARPRIAITLGDPAGIGPEIALKAALDERVTSICEPVLVGAKGVLDFHSRICGISIKKTRILETAEEPFSIGNIEAAHGRAALAAAKRAIDAALGHEVDAVVAAPQTELAVKRAGIEFDGYPSFVARCTGVAPEDAFLMLCFDATRIVHVTLHVSLRRAIELVTRERVGKAIRAAAATLRRLAIKEPKIAVSGLNPHAGEEGLFGDEEMRIISPAISDAVADSLAVDGPIGADILFNRKGYDAYVVMIHDQGHIVAKTQATHRTAGLTIGTPVLFSSVAHGSALDIAGQNRASPEAVIEAVRRLAGFGQT